jgi:hypothetical protein
VVSHRAADYLFAGSVRLRVSGTDRWVRHFDAEYGEIAAAEPGEPDVDVSIGYGWAVGSVPGGVTITGGHKTAHWAVALGAPEARPLRASLAIAGGPPAFLLSLVQGYFVEALVAVALARAGYVALPAAALVADGRAIVVLGRSGAGKTTLTARALAAGRTVISDDQVVLDVAGGVRRYPRRLRLYPDIRETAPEAWSRLPGRTRAALEARARVRRLTRGYVAPSLAVPMSAIGATVAPGPLPMRGIVVVDRCAEGGLMTTDRDTDWAVDQACLVLADQRVRLARAVTGSWSAALSDTLDTERDVVAAALAGVPSAAIGLPRTWGARRAVDALDDYLGITTGRGAPPGDDPHRSR